MPRAPLTPAERSLRARLAAHHLHAAVADPAAHTAPARAASPASPTYWERVVDPDGTLDPSDRARRADHARKAYFAGLSLKASKARRSRRTADGRPTGRDAA